MWFDEPHHLPAEALLPDWARLDMQGKKGEGLQYVNNTIY
jgi:hypothetical protein